MTNLEELTRSLIAEFTKIYDDLTNGMQNTSNYKALRLTCEVRDDARFYRIIDPRKNGGRPQYRGDFFMKKDVQETAACQYYTRARKQVAAMLNALEDFQDIAVNIDPNFYPETMPLAYQVQPPFIFDQMGVIDIEAWKNEPRQFSDRYPEDKKYRSRDGWMVRSKSEVIIADGYADAVIPYFYEVLKYIGGICLDPDFLALCVKRYLEIIHEHCGMMDDVGYVTKRFMPRLANYLRSGYTPGIDLIYTFETKDTPLTPQVVADTLSRYF